LIFTPSAIFPLQMSLNKSALESMTYEREERQPGYEREERQPGYERERRQPGYERERRQPSYERERRQPGYERERRQPGYEKGVVQVASSMWEMTFCGSIVTPFNDVPLEFRCNHKKVMGAKGGKDTRNNAPAATGTQSRPPSGWVPSAGNGEETSQCENESRLITALLRPLTSAGSER
jgi:hypothetical protein